ncbi:unnamed protein product, partial [Heterosigma akashiwo]
AYQLPGQHLAGHRREGHLPGQRRGDLAAARPEWNDAFTGQFGTSFCNRPVNRTLNALAHGTTLEDLRANSTLATARGPCITQGVPNSDLGGCKKTITHAPVCT